MWNTYNDLLIKHEKKTLTCPIENAAWSLGVKPQHFLQTSTLLDSLCTWINKIEIGVKKPSLLLKVMENGWNWGRENT